MLTDVHQNYNQQLDDNEREKDDWFDEIDTQACSFMRKVHGWLRETTQKTNSKSSSSSSKSNFRQRKWELQIIRVLIDQGHQRTQDPQRKRR